ncbi:hypothetical protein ACIPMZ_04775 [Scandinavium goeteborgense]|uniref:hypothetical protein n=1 Tax=Scandinavium goeteborgense TaxID=1851514 RepID=UPI0037FC8AE3
MISKKQLLFVALVSGPFCVKATDYNSHIMDTIKWLAENKTGLGYDLHSRFTEDLKYGDYTFHATKGTKTMCVAAVFEVLIRTLQNATDKNGQPVSTSLLTGGVVSGSKALNFSPYAFQYKALVNIPEYKRNYSAGIGDAFVLFGMGRYVTFDTAKSGDFIYFNRTGTSGHAVIYINYLNAHGNVESDVKNAIGFRYFSAQGKGTNGMGYRDAFFGSCPDVKTTYVKDCNVIKSDKHSLFAVSRLDDPKEWFTEYSAIRIERYFKGDSIAQISQDEGEFRQRAISDLEDAKAKAIKYAKAGKFPAIQPKFAGDADMAKHKLKSIAFDENSFGPNFDESI